MSFKVLSNPNHSMILCWVIKQRKSISEAVSGSSTLARGAHCFCKGRRGERRGGQVKQEPGSWWPHTLSSFRAGQTLLNVHLGGFTRLLFAFPRGAVCGVQKQRRAALQPLPRSSAGLLPTGSTAEAGVLGAGAVPGC